MIHEDERLDCTGFGKYKVIQKKGLGYGVDAVLLAAFAAGETGARAIPDAAVFMDFGCGSGIIGFILLHKNASLRGMGIDVRENAIDRARRAAMINCCEDRIRFVRAEIKEFTSDSKVDAVVSNPPYFRMSAAIPNDDSDKFIARHETTASFSDFMKTAAANLKDGGSVYLVHRPDRLVDLFQEMRANGIEPREMQMVVPKPGAASNIVLIHGVKGAGRELKMLPEIPVHNSDGSYSDIIEKLYERA